MVVEADESDGSFSRLKPTVAIVTNIDPEHLDHHGSFENLEQAFANFVSSIPFYGFATLCIDHPAVQRLLPTISDRRVITYGLSTNADIRAANPLGASGGGRPFSKADRSRFLNSLEQIVRKVKNA